MLRDNTGAKLNFFKTKISAELLGVKDLVPPYLDPNLQPQDLITGVSFASGGAGYDPLSATLAVSFFQFLDLNTLNNYNFIYIVKI